MVPIRRSIHEAGSGTEGWGVSGVSGVRERMVLGTPMEDGSVPGWTSNAGIIKQKIRFSR